MQETIGEGTVVEESAAPEQRGRLVLRLFGAFSALLDDKPLPGVHLREGNRLLAYLTLHQGQEVTYRALAERFWPAEARSVAEGGELSSTRQALRSLRVALGPHASRLQSVGRGVIRLDLTDADVDLLEFDRAAASENPADWQRALSLYRGRLLEDWQDSWVTPPRNRRQREYERLLSLVEKAIVAPEVREQKRTPYNLPKPVTSFVGRAKEIQEIGSLLAISPLLTLTGAGGCGKTRLSLEIASRSLDLYPDGVWFVELASLSDPSLVPQTVFQTLSLKEQSDRSVLPTLTEALKNQNLLIVLDNCEHVLAGCARLCAALLRSCPAVKVLATSREPLRIEGERAYAVPTLAAPPVAFTGSLESLLQYEAIRLFVERAVYQKHTFSVTEENAGVIAELCRGLDGLPLALELAAARIRSLSVQEINARLIDRFRLLTGGELTRPPRQQTLRALIDWSYELLSAAEASVFSRLSVFTGGWTLNAAEAVVSGQGIAKEEVLDLVESLVDKSLALAEEQNGVTRYRMLETIKQYAAERLQIAGERERFRTVHRDYFLSMVEEAEQHLNGPEQDIWLARLQSEQENLRAALAWTTAQAIEDAFEIVGRFGRVLTEFWDQRRRSAANGGSPGRPPLLNEQTEDLGKELDRMTQLVGVLGYQAYRSLFERGVEVSQRIGDRLGHVYNLCGLAWIVGQEGDLPRSRSLYGQAIALEQGANEGTQKTVPLKSFAHLSFVQGDYQTARLLYTAALDAARKTGDGAQEALSLQGLGAVAIRLGEWATARSFFEQSMARDAKSEDARLLVANLIGQGDVAREENDPKTARLYYRRCLVGCRASADTRGLLSCLEHLMLLAVAEGRNERAARLYGATEARRQVLGTPLLPADRAYYTPAITAARNALGNEGFLREWTIGRALSLEDAATLALAEDTNGGRQ